MTKRTFTREFLYALAHHEEHPEADNAEIVETIPGKPRRWLQFNTVIFKYEGKFYRTGWDVPLTETSGEFDAFNASTYAQATYDLDEVQKVPITKWTFMNYEEHKQHLKEKGDALAAQLDALRPTKE